MSGVKNAVHEEKSIACIETVIIASYLSPKTKMKNHLREGKTSPHVGLKIYSPLFSREDFLNKLFIKSHIHV